MKYNKYTYKSGRPMWQGGGYDVKTAYKKVAEEIHHNLKCEVVYHSEDGETISAIDVKVPSIYRSIKVNGQASISDEVKKMFLDYIENANALYFDKYQSAKSKHKNILDLFCVAIDVSQKCEQYFSAMIYKDYKIIIA